MVANKYDAYGCELLRNTTKVASVTNISGPGISLDTEDVTSHDSPNAWEEVVGTILRSGEITLDIIYDPGDATHKATGTGLIADLISRTVYASWHLQFSDGASTNWDFSAFVTGFEPSAPVAGALTAVVKLKLSGEPTLR